LRVSVVDAEVEPRNLPASDAVDEDGLWTNVGVNKMDAVV